MAYNTSRGPRELGDIKNENDPDTQIDFETDQISLKTGGIDRLTVTNTHTVVSGGLNVTGNVGIGTDSPDGKLHVMKASAGSVTVGGEQANGIIVEDDDSSSITLLDPSGGVIYFGDADDTDIGRIGYRHGGDYANSLYFTTNNAQRMTIDSSGKLGIGTSAPTHKLDINSDSIRLRAAKTPLSAAAAGAAGQICWDSSYIYICVATNTWKRVAISTW
jgi:hypothetical protein